MFTRLGRHIKEGFIGVIRHFGMAISSCASVTIALVLIGFFLIVVYNLNVISTNIESSISLSALVSYDYNSESMIKTLQDEILKIDGVEGVEYRTKDEEFTYYVEMYPEIREFNELYREDNPFHDNLLVSVVSGDKMESVKRQVESINGIDSVQDGGTNTYLLIDALNKIRLFGTIVVCALAFLATYLIYNTISITIHAREIEVKIMKNVGARNGYIRMPFLIEGIIIGIVGSILPIVFIVLSYLYLFNRYEGSIFGAFNIVTPNPFLIYISLILLAIGVLVGYIGSYLSVTRLLRSKR